MSIFTRKLNSLKEKEKKTGLISYLEINNLAQIIWPLRT